MQALRAGPSSSLVREQFVSESFQPSVHESKALTNPSFAKGELLHFRFSRDRFTSLGASIFWICSEEDNMQTDASIPTL